VNIVKNEGYDPEVADALRAELRGWRPRNGPDLIDLMRRADQSWQRPILILSAAGATALAVVLMAALAVVVAAPPIPAADMIREHLLAR
jgi:hypothetical protein